MTTITSVSPSNFDFGDTGIVASLDDNTGLIITDLYLSDTSNGTGTMVRQEITGRETNSITFTAIQGSLGVGTLYVIARISDDAYYVDGTNGSDSNDGSSANPFLTIRKALSTVASNVGSGKKSDKIFLKEGVYSISGVESDDSLYTVTMTGVVDDPSLISAMPATSSTPNAVQRKSGLWYERVIINDSYTVPNNWVVYSGNVWKIDLTLAHNTYTGTPLQSILNASTNSLNFGPAYLTQDGKPVTWVTTISGVNAAGLFHFDADNDDIYIWCFNDANPNNVVIETWSVASTQKERRRIFGGVIDYTNIVGLEFRFCLGLTQHGSGNKNNMEWRDLDTWFSLNHWFHEDITTDNWIIKNCRIFYNTREILQISGDACQFLQNEIVQPHPTWCPYNLVSLINLRVMPNSIIRGNVIYGNGYNSRNPGSVSIKWEMYAGHRLPGVPEAATQNSTIEGNFFLHHDLSPIDLGEGCTRMVDTFIRNNVFSDVPAFRGALTIDDAQTNLQIKNNTNYNVDDFTTQSGSNDCPGYKLGENYASTIDIQDNIFHTCNTTLMSLLTNPANPNDVITIDSNLWHNAGSTSGTNAITGDPLYANPSGFDFRLNAGSPGKLADRDLGAYGSASADLIAIMDWWRYTLSYFSVVKSNPLP